jgi:hypothetical protein
MHRLALALGLLLACGDGPPQRKPPPPLPGTTPAAEAQPAAPTPAPDTPAARELTAICLTTATLAPSLPPSDRFRRALVAAEAEPSQRVLALMRQCAAFRAQAAGTTDEAAFAWIRARVTAFADASVGLLPPAEAARLVELRKPLGL